MESGAANGLTKAMQNSPHQLLRVVLQCTLRQHHRDLLPLLRVVLQSTHRKTNASPSSNPSIRNRSG